MRPLSREYMTIGDLVISGRDDEAGVSIVLGDLDGAAGSPAPTLATTQRSLGHGVWTGGSYLGGRSIAVSGWIHGDDPEAAAAGRDRLKSAITLDRTDLVLVDGKDRRSTTVRRDGEVIVTRITDRTFSWSAQVIAEDPRWYGEWQERSTGVPTSTGGLAVPFTVPVVIASTVTSGEVSLINAGTIAAPVTVRFDGPLTGPSVRHTRTGRTVALSSALELAEGEHLIVQMDTRQVLAQGTASRSRLLTRREWSEALPGENTWAFTTATAGPGARMTVTTRSAWE
ncbi:hypothetical protein [Cellulomonas sp. NPDC089187]|uniref:phage distal tail protein n=1 Tax=Cellulomonas sp. NPDC089187 TaxID=3154970 RepID=UPI003441DC17